MTSIVSEIKDFLAHGRTSDALSRLLELSQGNKQIHDSILMVLAEFNDLNSARLRGTIHNEEVTLRQNKINEKVLMALDSFDSQGRVLPGSVARNKSSAAGILGKITIYLWGGAGIYSIIFTTAYWVMDWNMSGDGPLALAIIPVLLGLITFIGYVLAMVVGASKK